MKRLNLKYVSDIVCEEYKQWQPKDNVIIKAQTGTGKNYFTFNVLLKSLGAKERMLYMCNRDALKTETILELYKIQNIEPPNVPIELLKQISPIGKVSVMTYQTISIKEHKKFYNTLKSYKEDDIKYDFDSYKYCVFDEIHYILDDSFSGMTDLIFKKIIGSNGTIKIFMSATIDLVENAIKALSAKANSKTWNYNQAIDYSYITPYVFDDLEDMARLIKNDNSDDKWLIFVRKIEEKNVFEKILGNSLITFVKAGNRDKITEIVHKKTFKTKVLISTCVLDNGINLKDEKIKHIIITEFHKTKFIQMLGRVRFTNKSDGVYAHEINLYMPRLDDGRIYSRLLDKLKNHTKMVKERSCYESFCEKYDRQIYKLPRSMFYNTKKEKYVINSIGRVDAESKMEFYNEILTKLRFEKRDPNGKRNSIVNKRLGWLRLNQNQFEEIGNIVERDDIVKLSDYLQHLFENKVVFLTKSDRDELIKAINLIDHHNSCLKDNRVVYVQNIETLNNYLETTLEIGYKIKKFETSRIINGNKKNFKHAWKVVKIIE